MSAKELLQEFQALPATEQKKFLREARTSGRRGGGKRVGRAPSRPRKTSWPDVQARAAKVTGGRVLPNLILAERDNAAF
jgi:hypothetical protein